MQRARIQDAVLACATFAGTVFLFEAALYAPWIGPHSVPYLAMVAGLTLAAVLVLALLATIGVRGAAAQAAVVLITALTVFGADAELTGMGAARAGWVGLVLALALLLDRDLRTQPVALALLSAAAVCGSFRLWRLLCSTFGPLHSLTSGTDAAVADALVFAACVGLALAYSAVRRRRVPKLPVAATVASLALVLATIGHLAGDIRWIARQGRPALAPVGPRADALAAERPSILILVLDTVGADRLSIYGHSRATTPELQGLLDRTDRAVRYPLAFAPAPWTLPSHASLFTGLLPSEHGIERADEKDAPRIRHRVLSQALREQGYRTAAVLANPILYTAPGMLDGFEHVVRTLPLHRFQLTLGETARALWLPGLGTRATKPTPPAEVINRGVLDAVRECGDAPCLIVANYMDAHLPYTPHAPHAGTWENRRGKATGRDAALQRDAARHDEAIRGLDAALGKLLAELAASGVLERWWIVITADHGEAFGEHGYTMHRKGLHVEQTKIPLLIQPPSGVRLEVRQDAVSLLDVATTLAAVGGVDGFGVGEDLRRPAADRAVPVAMEFAGVGKLGGAREDDEIPPSRAVVVSRRQLIESAGLRELYDLDQDPGERNDLAVANPAEVERLAGFLPPGFGARLPTPPRDADTQPADEIDEETQRALRTLGYVD